MSIFPLISDVGSNEVETVDDFPLYREVAWDYKYDMPVIENGNFKVVEGNEAIKVWCYKALLVPRFQHSIYSSLVNTPVLYFSLNSLNIL